MNQRATNTHNTPTLLAQAIKSPFHLTKSMRRVCVVEKIKNETRKISCCLPDCMDWAFSKMNHIITAAEPKKKNERVQKSSKNKCREKMF